MKLIKSIRQQLIKKGHLRKYIFYAVSEIVLVMFGILLALQVNNWNQNRIQKKKEKKALVDLYQEFKMNDERIRDKQLMRISISPKLEKYIEQVSTGKASYKSFEDFHLNLFMFGMTNPSNGVIDALISSGEIALISNDYLKYLIADWKNQTENLYENEQILWTSGLNYIECYSDKIPIPSHDWNDWTDEQLEIAFGDLISNVKYKNNLVGFEGVHTIVIEECDKILELLNKILILLEDEMKERA